MTRNLILGIGIAGILFTALLSFMNFLEWYTVAISDHHGPYHFGTEAPSPYYYRNSSLYASVMFAWGALFLVNLVYLLWSLIRKRHKNTLTASCISILLFLTMFIQSTIDGD